MTMPFLFHIEDATHPLEAWPHEVHVEYVSDPIRASPDVGNVARTFALRLTLLTTGLPIERVTFLEKRDDLLVRVTLRVRHRDTGNWVMVLSEGRIPWHALTRGDELLHHMVMNQLRRAIIHELDECLLWDGRPLKDPHAGGANG
jgi:hypothetical protein